MFGFVLAAGSALVISASSAFIPEGTTPAGTFACSLVSSDSFDGNTDGMIVSSLGEFTLDGNGGYTHGAGVGNVAWKNGGMHFTSGDMSGTVAVVRRDKKGRRYLHIDGTLMTEPAGEPKFGDQVCVEK
jgi:hypothetical protein